ncbi:MAG: beta-lactamase family protein [Chloroflexi bacterium]|nr:beta-lactamase family protein [Chloroflexota bacterium]
MNTTHESIINGEIGQTLDDTLSPLVQNAVRSCDLPGVAIGIVADNEIGYARGFGVQNSETQAPVSVETIFHMASISKPFVATAIVQLVEQGQVQLDAPVIAYLPFFQLDDDRYRDITVQQMLSHVSGMPDVEDYEWGRPQYDDGALERYVRSLSSEKLIAAPGEKFAYSNMAFECLGAVIAQVSGLSFDEYVKRHILDPAGMVESTFLKPALLPANWAAPHVRVLTRQAWAGYPYNRMHGPSSTLHSNAPEMCNWAIANLNRGSFQGRQILDPASYDLLWTPRAAAGDEGQVGLSWFIGAYRGETTISHGGGDIGFETNFVMLPDRQAAVVVLCNLIPAPVDQITHAALDILLGYEPGPILPYASIVVGKTMREQGLNAAVAQWRSLQAQHPDEYDFGPAQFDSLFIATSLGKVSDAERIARLCARVLPEPDVQTIANDLARYDNRAAMAVLSAIREHRPGSSA